MTVRPLEPNELHLIEPLIEDGSPPIDPEWAQIIASFDDEGKIVGFVALQLVLHAEPIVIAKELRKKGHWRELVEYVDGYLYGIGAAQVYTQPLHPNTEHICRETGYVKAKKPLYIKDYRKLDEE
jgi:hypothetical protein